MKNLFKKIWVFLFKRKRREEIFFEEIFFVDDLPTHFGIEKPQMIKIVLERWKKNILLQEFLCGINSFQKEVLKGVAPNKKNIFSFSKEKIEERKRIQKRLTNIFAKEDLKAIDLLETKKNGLIFLIIAILITVFFWFIMYVIFSASLHFLFYFPGLFSIIYILCINNIIETKYKKIQVLVAKAMMLDQILRKYI